MSQPAEEEKVPETVEEAVDYMNGLYDRDDQAPNADGSPKS
jgi:hypothetical protein